MLVLVLEQRHLLSRGQQALSARVSISPSANAGFEHERAPAGLGNG